MGPCLLYILTAYRRGYLTIRIYYVTKSKTVTLVLVVIREELMWKGAIVEFCLPDIYNIKEVF